MKLLLTLTSAILAITAVVAQSGASCGLRIAPCPEDEQCVPNTPDCTDPDRCPGQCEFKNTYASCGGFRPEPLECDASAECRDDPRNPESCGMACDAPGICIPKRQFTCRPSKHRRDCPNGLFCYALPKWMTKKGRAGGVCL